MCLCIPPIHEFYLVSLEKSIFIFLMLDGVLQRSLGGSLLICGDYHETPFTSYFTELYKNKCTTLYIHTFFQNPSKYNIFTYRPCVGNVNLWCLLQWRTLSMQGLSSDLWFGFPLGLGPPSTLHKINCINVKMYYVPTYNKYVKHDDKLKSILFLRVMVKHQNHRQHWPLH